MPDAPEQNQNSKSGKSQLVVAWVIAGVMAVLAGFFAWVHFTLDSTVVNQDPAQQTASQNQAEENQPPVEEPSAYEAEVGQFRLTLSEPYVVIERLDAGFEGGPATVLDIGRIQDGYVSTDPAQAFNIFARPEAGATLEDNSAVGALAGNELVTRQPDTQFSGVQARLYQEDGLFRINYLIFVNDGIVYRITWLADSEDQTEIYSAVESAFSFLEE